jgi:four helix bundle protein
MTTSKFDLEERTSKFGIETIRFCKTININDITRPLINQLIRSATSVGANYMEANGADSKNDFRNKISICKKEAKETMHWLRMVIEADPKMKVEAMRLWTEAKELSLIFGAINRNLK